MAAASLVAPSQVRFPPPPTRSWEYPKSQCGWDSIASPHFPPHGTAIYRLQDLGKPCPSLHLSPPLLLPPLLRAFLSAVFLWPSLRKGLVYPCKTWAWAPSVLFCGHVIIVNIWWMHIKRQSQLRALCRLPHIILSTTLACGLMLSLLYRSGNWAIGQLNQFHKVTQLRSSHITRWEGMLHSPVNLDSDFYDW